MSAAALWSQKILHSSINFSSFSALSNGQSCGRLIVYGDYFRQRVYNMGMEEVVIAARSPWQNPYAERMIGALRRELLDRVIVLNEAHLRRLMTSYLAYYHTVRPHMALERNALIPKPIQRRREGQVVAVPYVGGLHHGYRRAA